VLALVRVRLHLVPSRPSSRVFADRETAAQVAPSGPVLPGQPLVRAESSPRGTPTSKTGVARSGGSRAIEESSESATNGDSEGT
jgi:hypothetical protein